jgi:hypothetical protein
MKEEAGEEEEEAYCSFLGVTRAQTNNEGVRLRVSVCDGPTQFLDTKGLAPGREVTLRHKFV